MKLYVGNLPFSTTDLELKDTFQAWGYAVTEAKVIMDRDTGKSRGFGFVTLDPSVDGQKVIQESDGRDFGGRQVTINEAKQQEPRRGGGGGGRSGYGGGGGGRDNRGGGGGRGNRGNGRGGNGNGRGGREERSSKGFWDGEK